LWAEIHCVLLDPLSSTEWENPPNPAGTAVYRPADGQCESVKERDCSLLDLPRVSSVSRLKERMNCAYS
jgi:hypothetical protein